MPEPDNSTQISNRNIVLILCFVILLPTVGANYEVVCSNITTFWAWASDGSWEATRIDNTPRFWAHIATIAGAFIAFLGLGGIYYQLHENAKQAKRVKTYEFLEKYYDPGFVSYSEKARERLRESSVLTSQETEDNPELVTQIISFLNYFEDACLMYNMGLIDKEIFRKSMKDAIIVLYDKYKDHIQELKNAGKASGGFCEQFKTTYDEFIQK